MRLGRISRRAVDGLPGLRSKNSVQPSRYRPAFGHRAGELFKQSRRRSSFKARIRRITRPSTRDGFAPRRGRAGFDGGWLNQAQRRLNISEAPSSGSAAGSAKRASLVIRSGGPIEGGTLPRQVPSVTRTCPRAIGRACLDLPQNRTKLPGLTICIVYA